MFGLGGSGLGETPVNRRNNPLPPGTLTVAAGLAVNGIAVYAFTVLASRNLDDSSGVLTLWFLVYVLGPGLFYPVEQELSRAVTARMVLHERFGPVARRAALLTAGLVSVLVVLAAVGAGPAADAWFDGQTSLVLVGAMVVASYGALHWLRGVLGGTQHFGVLGQLLAAEGGSRLIFAAVLVAAGAASTLGFALCMLAAPLFAWVVGWLQRPADSGTQSHGSWRDLSEHLGWLLIGALLSQTLANAAPLAVALLAKDHESDVVEAFSAAVFVTRVPLFLFQAVQVSLLPRLTALATQGQWPGFRQGLRRLMLVVGGITVLGVVGAAIVGPFVTKIAYDQDVDRGELVLLTAGVGATMGAIALSQAQVALRRHARVALGWGVGLAAFVVMMALPGELIMRASLASLGGAVCACLALSWGALPLRPPTSAEATSGTDHRADDLGL